MYVNDLALFTIDQFCMIPESTRNLALSLVNAQQSMSENIEKEKSSNNKHRN